MVGVIASGEIIFLKVWGGGVALRQGDVVDLVWWGSLRQEKSFF